MGLMGALESLHALHALMNARDFAGGSVDTVDVEVYVDGGKVSLGRQAKLSDYRFEGFVHPEAYLLEDGRIRHIRSPWSESLEDVKVAMSHFRTNRSRHKRVMYRKAARFRVGTFWEHTLRTPGYYRTVAMNATAWMEVIRSVGVELSGSYVNFGAADGVGDDPLNDFAKSDVRQRGRALAVEADPQACEEHRRNLPWVHLECNRVTVRNTEQLLSSVFPTSTARAELDILKVDIDSYEGPIVEECLWRAGLSPKLLLIEVNSGIPPPLQFALLDSPQLQSSYPEIAIGHGDDVPLQINKPIAGVSLSYLVRRLAPAYALLELGSPDAIFVRKDIMDLLGRAPLDEFEAFARGWSDVHGFSRHQIRRWFFEMDEVEALGDVFNYLVSWMRNFLGDRVLPFVLTY